MGVIQSLLGKQKKVQFIQQPTGTIFTVECSTNETHSRESPATEFPIESGDTVNDNILIRNFVLELKGTITDNPLSPTNALVTTAIATILPAAVVVAASAAQAVASAIAGSSSPSVQAYEQLLTIQASRMPFDVVTSLKRYNNMWINSLSVPRQAQNGNELEFTVKLAQLNLVSPQYVNIQIYNNADLAASQANAGNQQTSAFLKGLQNGSKATGQFLKNIGGG